MIYSLNLYGGLGDGFLTMYKVKEHLILKDFKQNNKCDVINFVISNNEGMPELYKLNPLISDIVYFNETLIRIEAEKNNISFLNQIKKTILSTNHNAIPLETQDLSSYKESDPEFSLTEEEELMVKQIALKPFVFLHLYSATPNKQIEKHLPFIKLINFIIDELGLNVVLFGKDTILDKHSEKRGYPSSFESFQTPIKGLYNFTNTHLHFNNPRVGWHLCQKAKFCVITESAYLQAATYLDKDILVLLGPNLLSVYLKDINHVYFFGMKKKKNFFVDVAVEKFDNIIKKIKILNDRPDNIAL